MLAMMKMIMIMIKQNLTKEIQVCEQPEVRCSLAYSHHLYKIFFIPLSKPSWTIFIRNPAMSQWFIGNHWLQSLLLGGRVGCCTATENGHPPWWGNRSVPGSLVTSYFDSRKHFRYRCLSIANIRTPSTSKRNKFSNFKEKCDSWKDLLSQGMGSSRESYRRRSRDGREG